MTNKEQKIRRNKIRKDRVWNNFLYFCNFKKWPAFINLKEITDYNPEDYREAFERYQTGGKHALKNAQELLYIQPILDGQRQKEILLDSLAEESMEYWAKGWGWIYPWVHTLDMKVDRLTKVAILRSLRTMLGTKLNCTEYHPENILNFFVRHPGIKPKTKKRFLDLRGGM